jgi:hypothetical protein
LWHIPYHAQYVLWKEDVKRKSEEWLHVVAELMEICAIRPLVDCRDTIEAMVASKRDRLEKIMEYCRTTSRAKAAVSDGEHEGQCEQVECWGGT